MTQAKFRERSLALLASLAIASWAIAQESSKKDSKQNESNSSNQDSGQQSAQQNQGQASSTDKSSSQQSEKRSNENSNKSQNQSNRDAENRADRDSASKQDSSAQSDRRDRRDSDDSRSEERRSSSRDQDSRAYDRDADNRSRADDRRSREDSSSNRRDSRREMRGPDIGIWFGRSSNDGLVIADISSKGAIAKLGFHEGDRIVSVNGRRVSRESDFIDFLFRSDVDRVKVIVIRDGREQTIHVEPVVLIREYENVEVDPLERFGIIIDDRYDDRIVVWRVIPRSPAYYAGFRPGDVVVTFAGRPYRTRIDFEKSARDWKPGEVNVQIRRGDRTRELSVDVPKYDRSSDRNARRDDRMVRSASGQSESGSADRSSERRNDNQSQDNQRGGLLRGRGSR